MSRRARPSSERRRRPPSGPSRTEAGAGLFAQLLQARLTPTEAAAAHPVEPLAHLDYGRELDLKGQALAAFWAHHGLAGEPAPIVPSPRPRHYRTTTRRRARYRAGRLQLGFGEAPGGGSAGPDSALDPAAHTALYRYLAAELSAPPNRSLASHLNCAIIRGSYEAFCVILNLDRLSGPIVRRLKVVAERLQARPERVLAAFAFCDPSRSEYYFERDPPPAPVRLKKLFGPARFPLTLAGRRFALPPTAFSQVNESMVEPLLATVRQLLEPRPGDRLLDLYCGYGLFSLALAGSCAEVVGLDLDRAAIRAAADQLRHGGLTGRVTFSRRDISSGSLARALPAGPPSTPGGRELALLDPPRQGTDPGVPACLAARGPAAAVHIFCGIEALPPALSAWAAAGYEVARSAPLDMFAGTPALEIPVLLRPLARRT